MESIRVVFYGICTHFQSDSIPEPVDWYHRVVLVNARNLAGDERLRGIADHYAHLQIRRSDIIGELPVASWFPITFYDGEFVQWRLAGTHLRAANVVSTSVPDGRPSCIPSMSSYLPPDTKIPNPGPAVTERVPDRTAAHFDFGPVVVQPRIINKAAAVALIEMESTQPGIDVRSFLGETLSIPLQPDAEVTVSNIPEESKDDDDHDFLLHYLTLETFPDGVHFSSGPFHCAEDLHPLNPPIRIGLLTTPGCSNSLYP